MDQAYAAEESSCCVVPPGFRFHPTEEELVGYYLARKVSSEKIDLDIIQEVDLYRIEPWDLQGRCSLQYGGGEDQTATTMTTEWYFFSYKDRKYPSGTRTNRATAAGFWKATGRDKPVLSSGRASSSRVIGMRKTLVFYKGRAPNGRKTDWIIHEYRLQSNELAPAQEEGWVVCRAFQKPIPNQRWPLLYPSSYAGTPGYPNTAADLHRHHLLLGGLARPAAAFFPHHHQQLQEDMEESKTHLLSIPQLVQSPAAMACSLEHIPTERGSSNTAEPELIQQLLQGGDQQASASAIDWSFLDALVSSTMTSHAAS